MPIPNANRVSFEINPLVEVVTQLIFPRLLEIDTDLPARFQQLIHVDYPILTAGKVIQFSVDTEKVPEQRSSEGRRYEFVSIDRRWQAVLTSEFIALTTSVYADWDEFKDRATQLIGAFLKCYGPAHFSRIGLRYRDTISRAKYGLADVPWSELLEPHILGPLSSVDINETELLGYRSSFALSLAPSVKVQVTYGLVPGTDSNLEYMIDSDFFRDQPTTKADLDAATDALTSFRPHTYTLFRWCISQRLFEAMVPKAISQ